MEVSTGDVVMPGDSLKDIKSIKKEGKNERENVILGPGLRREGDKVYVCKAGILKKREPAVYYVDSYQKRYRNSIVTFYVLYIRFQFIYYIFPLFLISCESEKENILIHH